MIEAFVSSDSLRQTHDTPTTQRVGTCRNYFDDKVNTVTTPQNPSNRGSSLRDRYAARPVAPVSPQTAPEVVEDPHAAVNADPYGLDARRTPEQWRDIPQEARSVGDTSNIDTEFEPVANVHGRDDSDDYARDDDYRVNTKRDRPQVGFRSVLANKLGVPIGKGKAELEYDHFIARINRGLRNPKVIGVLGGKGGVGKTTSAMVLASTLAQHRSKPVVTITLDYNNTLALRTKAVADAPRGNISLLDFATDQTIRTPNDVAGCMRSNKHRLSVLGTGLSALRHEILTPEQFTRGLSILKSNYELILVDFGNSPNTETYWTALAALDSMVLVTSTENDSLQGARSVEGIARDAGLLELMDQRTTVLVNHRSSADPKVNLETFVNRQHSVKAREVLDIPWDDHLSESGPVDLDLLSKPTRYQYVRAAALVVSSLPA